MSDVSKRIYERVADIAEALPETNREEFAELLNELQRYSMHTDSQRRVGIRRWLKDAGWGCR